MINRPDYLTQSDVARLIPVVADSNKEQRATSILLASLRGSHEFRKMMLGTLGQRVGKRAELQAWTEVGFPKEDELPKADRPDGIFILNTGRKNWTALVEAKIGNSKVGEDQLKNYLLLAKKYNIDAVITISNQFVAMPTHHPIKVPKNLVKGTALFHWSWMYIVTQATLLLEQDTIDSPEEHFILEEVRRYLSNDSSGISRFDSMNSEWKEVCSKVKSGGSLNKNSEEVTNTVSSWHQEQRDLCLVMSRKLGETVRLKLPRNHSTDPEKRLKDDSDLLAKEKVLRCTLEVPNAASDIEVVADLTKRTITSAMRLGAPQDKKSLSARVNWIARQLSKSDASDIYVKAIRPGRAEETQAPLSWILKDSNSLDSSSTQVVPSAFEVFHLTDLAGKFSGTKKFIEDLEKSVPLFYEQIGQRLRAWVAPPPKMNKRDPAKDVDDNEETVDSSDNSRLSEIDGFHEHADRPPSQPDTAEGKQDIFSGGASEEQSFDPKTYF